MNHGCRLLVSAKTSVFALIFGFEQCPECPNWTYEPTVLKIKSLEIALEFESLNEVLDHRHMNWMEKVVKMPAILDDKGLPRKLLGAWCFGGKR